MNGDLSIFEKIAAGIIPADVIAEDMQHMAVLDINPIKIGHTVVFPKKCTETFLDMSNEDYSSLFTFVKTVAADIKSVIPCKRIAIVVCGTDVPHVHVHVIPINTVADLDFNGPKISMSKDARRRLVEKIQQV